MNKEDVFEKWFKEQEISNIYIIDSYKRLTKFAFEEGYKTAKDEEQPSKVKYKSYKEVQEANLWPENHPLNMYDTHCYRKFVVDMCNAGYEMYLQNYHGHNYYNGPAVVVNTLIVNYVINSTKLNLKQDSLGKATVLYPIN